MRQRHELSVSVVLLSQYFYYRHPPLVFKKCMRTGDVLHYLISILKSFQSQPALALF